MADTPVAQSAVSLREQVARIVDPSLWAQHDKMLSVVAERLAKTGPLWDGYEDQMRAHAAEIVAPALAKADSILSLILPLLREAGEVVDQLGDKLDAVHKASAGVFQIAFLHGYRYSGPNWTDELSAARSLSAKIKEFTGAE